jgi:predicted transcriptional regulator
MRIRIDDVEVLRRARQMCEDGTARLLVEQSGLTQASCAQVVETNQPTMSRWLSGTRLPRSTAPGLRFARLLDRLARASAEHASTSGLTVLVLALMPMLLGAIWSLALSPGIFDELLGKLTVPVPVGGRVRGLGRDASYAAAGRGELPVARSGRRVVVLVVPLLRELGLTDAQIAEVVGIAPDAALDR